MKKIFITFLLVILFIPSFYARPILSMTKWDGGKHGYNYVSANLVTTSSGTEGWEIECHSPGYERCARPSGTAIATGLDLADIQIAEELVELAEGFWDDGLKQGSESKLVQMPNEGFVRQYVVSWYVSDRRIHIDVVRNDISL